MPNNTEIEDKKTEINFNNKNILLHSSITFPFNSATSDLDLGKNLEIWIFWGGVFCNFGFGLREKLGNLDFPEGGVFCNFGFGLREKLGNLDFPERGGYSATLDLDLGKNLEIWIFQRGGILQLRIWT